MNLTLYLFGFLLKSKRHFIKQARAKMKTIEHTYANKRQNMTT
jgi:hypothetical protein